MTNLESADTAFTARVDQIQAQVTTLTQAAAANSQAIAQLQTAQTQILNGCIALQAAINDFRFQVHRTLRGEGMGI